MRTLHFEPQPDPPDEAPAVARDAGSGTPDAAIWNAYQQALRRAQIDPTVANIASRDHALGALMRHLNRDRGGRAHVSLGDLVVAPSPHWHEQPARRTTLLHDVETDRPVYIAGKVGALHAPGGTGKSFAMESLGVAKAAGLKWFAGVDGKGWAAKQSGPVIYFAGEDDALDAKERFFHVCRAMCLTPEDVARVQRNLRVVPLAGHPAALQGAMEDGRYSETEMSREVREILAEAAARGEPYELILFDPQARFANPDAEISTAGATAFITLLESYAADYGKPTIIVAAHERKPSKGDDGGSDAMRGASALRDGYRQTFKLERLKRRPNAPDLLKLTISKANAVSSDHELILRRHPEHGGALTMATDDEVEAYRAAGGTTAGDSAAEKARALQQSIVAQLKTKPQSQNDLVKALHSGNKTISGAVSALQTAGLIERRGQTWALVNVN